MERMEMKSMDLIRNNIDPLYNTGSNFIYADNFTQSAEDYEEEIGLCDEDRMMLLNPVCRTGSIKSEKC